MMRLDFERVPCPSCGKDVVIQNKSSGGTAAPMEHKKVAVASPKCGLNAERYGERQKFSLFYSRFEIESSVLPVIRVRTRLPPTGHRRSTKY